LPEPEPDSQKWPDIRPTGTGTGYPVHPYVPASRLGLVSRKNCQRLSLRRQTSWSRLSLGHLRLVPKTNWPDCAGHINKKLIRRWDSERELFMLTSYTHYSPRQSSLRLWKSHMSIGAIDVHSCATSENTSRIGDFAPMRSLLSKISGTKSHPQQ